ncbi:uncharacterized protein LOC129602243 [Paramacrobiotus metropolitanus]|uniref:uncharacterized protein LOC129602243 n=1 Tax=Paramacrobiotus metropolitanus TaxID=2943436 RepID=UPI002445C4D0|nr:uncharacterized protein LOC129602243 [Paramacrobiotus metropolitanus]
MAFRVLAGLYLYTVAVTFLGCLHAEIVPTRTRRPTTTTTLGPTDQCYNCAYKPRRQFPQREQPLCNEDLWKFAHFQIMDVPLPEMTTCAAGRCSLSLSYAKIFGDPTDPPTSKVAFALGCLSPSTPLNLCLAYSYANGSDGRVEGGSDSCFHCGGTGCNIKFLTKYFRWFADTAAAAEKTGRPPTKLPDFYATTTPFPYDYDEETTAAAERVLALPLPLIILALLVVLW